MSEFECKNFHILTSKDKGVCPECGEGIRYMDGYSSRQLKEMEKLCDESIEY